MNDNRIAEVRGIAAEQNLDPYIVPVVQQKLKEFPDGKAYEKKAGDMKKLTEIEKKMKFQEVLDVEELKFLYEMDAPIDGFGYQKDPRIKELLDQRDKKADAPLVFECRPDQIAYREADITADTKAYIGPLFDGFFEKIPKGLTHVYASFPEGRIHQETVSIDTEKSWREQFDDGHYDWKNPEFDQWVSQDKRFPLEKKKRKTEKIELLSHDLVLVAIPRTVSTDEANKEIVRLGFENGTTEDLLALGAQNPNLQRKFYIVALGSSAPHSFGFTVVPVLYGDGAERLLSLHNIDDLWNDDCRFLARRK